MKDKIVYVLEKLVPGANELGSYKYLISYQPCCFVLSHEKAKQLCKLAGKDKNGVAYVRYNEVIEFERYSKLGYKLGEVK